MDDVLIVLRPIILTSDLINLFYYFFGFMFTPLFLFLGFLRISLDYC
jgi:hypothetical protein